MNPLAKTSFATYQGLYHEEQNAIDGKAYYYMVYQMAIDQSRQVHFLKIRASDNTIMWNFARIGLGSNSLPTP